MHDVMRRTGRALAHLALFCLLTLALLGTAASASGQAGEEKAIRSAIGSYLRSYQEKAMLDQDRDLRSGTVADPGLHLGAADQSFVLANGKSAALSELRENIIFAEKKAVFYAGMRQLQGISREGLRLRYALEELEMKANACRASVRETAEFRYTDSDRPSVYETYYTVDLLKLEGRWLVADVTDGTRFDKLYKKYGASFNERANLSQFAKQLAQENCTVHFPDPGSGGGNRIPYSGKNAAAYAYTYSRRHMDETRADVYNAQFMGYAGEGGDCQNFASQCMWAGFGGSQTSAAIRGRSLPMDTAGTNQWFGRAAGGGALNYSWLSCQTFRQYLTGSRDGVGQGGSNAAGDAGMYATVLDVGTGSALTGVAPQELVGATAHVEGSGGSYSHAIVLTAATGNSRSQIWFCGHTKDITHVKLGDYYIWPMLVYIPRYLRTGASQADPIQTDRLQPVEAGSTGLLYARRNAVQYRMSITVTPPGGTASQVAGAEHNDNCWTDYLFSAPGLYRVDCRAQASEKSQETAVTYYVRCYAPETDGEDAGLPSGSGAEDPEMPGWLRQPEDVPDEPAPVEDPSQPPEEEPEDMPGPPSDDEIPGWLLQ